MQGVVRTDFLQKSPLTVARRYAEADLYAKATSDQLAWLYTHAILWLRALTVIRREVENHIAKDRMGIADLKPPTNVHASPEYLAAKKEMDARTVKRLHFLQFAERRSAEVKALLGSESLCGLMIGDLVSVFEEIAVMADTGDTDGAVHLARRWAERIHATLPERMGRADD